MRDTIPDSIMSEDSQFSRSSTHSATNEIKADIQKQMFEKAKNYIGHNVLLDNGVIIRSKAKKKKDLKNYVS